MAETGAELIISQVSTKISQAFDRARSRQLADEVSDGTGYRLGVPRKRFKEGFTTEEQFIEELRSLRIPEEDIGLEIAASNLDYAYDLTMDMLSVWRDGVRKGNITLDQYQQYLLELGIVPEKVGGYILREVMRQAPENKPGLVGPATPLYETDAGKVQVDTIRRARRKLLLTRDEELAQLMELGMPATEASSIADNDDVRIAEKGGAES